ncbi:hypothetical protein PGTUg99_026454 [Puccinia graminis f. sp. tritici]|uniref:Uncharacterized protein n=1 Tax=Puccinia graminis f. sp. tritici TaxID=56615 RepID=A0A5B0SC75_PUCGR|nr:hypothetical protein PGTUg99_026454 [Puccinia graminis f. sp. tritici]
MRQTNKWLLDLHKDSHVETVDFDVLAVFIMQETDAKMHIRDLVATIIETFAGSSTPQTNRQNQLLDAAFVVYETIYRYDQGVLLQPDFPKPFCIRHPSLLDVLKYSMKMEKKCKIIEEAKKMIILIDENGICVGVGLPPYPAPPKDSKHIAHDARALATLKEMAETPVCKLNLNQYPPLFFENPPSGPPQTPFSLNSKTKGDVRAPAKSLDASVSYQTYGFGLGGKKSAGVLDKKIACDGKSKSIKTEELQGHNDGWKEKKIKPELPDPLRDYSNTLDNQALAKLRNEMTFYSKLTLAINLAFLPETSDVAVKAVDYLKDEGTDLVQERLKVEKNEIIASRTVSVNTQIHTHRDKKNALLFDSVYFFGNHDGGNFLFPSLGVALTGLHGYSVHGPFRILYHGVAQYHFKQDIPDAPYRFSVAMWSRESSFTSIARHSAYHKKDNQTYSDSTYWLPIYPEYKSDSVREYFEKYHSESRDRPRNNQAKK